MKRISFVGDLMFKEQAVPIYVDKDGNYDFSCIFSHVKDELRQSDYVLGNLETTVNDIDDSHLSTGVNFNAPVQFLIDLKEAGFSYLATGNNHCLNRGIKGLKRTIENIESVGFDHGGTNYNLEQRKYTVFYVGKCKFCVLSYTYGTNTLINKYFLSKEEVGYVNLFQEQQYQNKTKLWMASNKFFLIRWIYRAFATLNGEAHLGEQSEHTESNSRCRKEIRDIVEHIKKDEKPDYIIMMMHAGGRYHEKPSKWEVELASFLKDIGIDIIIGHHEHRVQKMMITSDKKSNICAYDLGNFCSTTGAINGPYNRLSEVSLILNLYISDKAIDRVSVIPCMSVLESGKVVTVVANDYLNNCVSEKERTNCSKKVKKVMSILLGKKVDEIKREYFFDV